MTVVQGFCKFFPPGGGVAFIEEHLFVLAGDLRKRPFCWGKVFKRAGAGENVRRHGNFQNLAGTAEEGLSGPVDEIEFFVRYQGAAIAKNLRLTNGE